MTRDRERTPHQSPDSPSTDAHQPAETQVRPDRSTGDEGGETTTFVHLVFVAVGFTLGSTLLATLVSPSFVWEEHALSNLGVATDPGTETTVLLFNGGLVTGGIIGLVFTVQLFPRVQHRTGRVVVGLVGCAFVFMGLVGVFPQGQMLHFPVAITFFLLVPVVLGVEGVRGYRAGDTRWGLLSIAGALANVVLWSVWFAAVSDPYEGIAIPEMVGAVIFGVWVCVFALRTGR